MLALAFLVCIGGLLIVEAFHLHIEKSYVYVAMGFSLIVEMLQHSPAAVTSWIFSLSLDFSVNGRFQAFHSFLMTIWSCEVR